MEWKFTLIDRNGLRTEIDEPVGWADQLDLKLRRDKDMHGIFFEFQDGGFQYTDKARKILQDEYDEYGVQGVMYLLIEENSFGYYKFFYSGKMLFAKFSGTSEDGGSLKIPIENIDEIVMFRNRMDQKVDLTKDVAFDGVTALTAYPFLGFSTMIPSKAILLRSKEFQTEQTTSQNLALDPEWHTFMNIVPGFANIELTDIKDTTFRNDFAVLQVPDGDYVLNGDLVPTLDVNQSSNVKCTAQDYSFKMRFKGRVTQIKTSPAVNPDFTGHICLFKIPAGSPATAQIQIFRDSIWLVYGSGVQTFDVLKDIVLNDVVDGDKFYFFIHAVGDQLRIADFKITLDAESYMEMTTLSLCDPSPAKVFMVNEALSRITESITNNALKVYSQFFGRTNSLPYSFPSNGKGSLKCLSNGLMIRQAKKTDGSEPSYFISMKEAFEGLNALHPIGMGIDSSSSSIGEFNNDFGDDFNTGSIGRRLVIEDYKFFYQSDIVFTCDNVDKVNVEARTSDYVTLFKCGFEKWEAEEYNGLDEFLTKRNYRTNISAVSGVLDKICKMIGSPYTIETTRRKAGSTTDWRYDNDSFVICMKVDGSGFTVEQGNIITAVNIIDAGSFINYRISPARIALAWLSKILCSYKKLDANSKLIFTDGDGNFIASGELDSLFAKAESGPIAENDSLDITKAADQDEAKPIFKLDTVGFEYPLSMRDYVKIKASPYKKIAYTNPEYSGSGWIDEIAYRPNDGKAKFTLIAARDDD
jgi:hypothetical protein